MSWFDKDYTYRYPVAVENTGVTANHDISILIPSEWDTFWESINSNGFDVVPVTPHGNLIAFQRSGFNYANRALTLQLDSTELTGASVSLIYIYFKKTGETDQSSVVSISTPKSGQIWLGRPKNMVVGPTTFTGSASNPTNSFVMNTYSNSYVWFSLQNLLSTRFSTYNDRANYEEILNAKVDVVNSGGASQAGMFDQNKTRFGNGFVGVYLQGGGGVDGSNYQIKLTVQTTQQQIFGLTATLQIRNQLPA